MHGWGVADCVDGVWLPCRFGSSLRNRAYVLYLMFFSFILFEFWVIIKLIAPQQMPPAPYEAGSLEEIVYLLQQFGDIKFEGLCVGLAVTLCGVVLTIVAVRSYEVIIVVQFCLEFFLFMFCAAAVRWPRPALVRSRKLSAWRAVPSWSLQCV